MLGPQNAAWNAHCRARRGRVLIVRALLFLAILIAPRAAFAFADAGDAAIDDGGDAAIDDGGDAAIDDGGDASDAAMNGDGYAVACGGEQIALVASKTVTAS